MGLDTDKFVDEGNVEAGLPANVEVDDAPPVEGQAAETEAQQAETSAAEQTATAESSEAGKPEAKVEGEAEASEDRSFLVPERDQQQGAETTVPVHVVAKLRAEKRELKQQLEEARTRPAGAKAADVGPDPLEGLEDDEFLTAGQIRAARVRDQAIAEQVRQDAERQTAQTVQQKKVEGFLLESERQAKADHPDFTAVMTAAEDYMSPVEFQAALQTRNPAKVLYAKAKQTIAALGIEVQAPEKTTKNEPSQGSKTETETEAEALQSDDEVFDELFPEENGPAT